MPEGVHASQLVQSVEQPGFHRAHGAAQGGSNALQRFSHIEAQLDDLLMLGGEGLDASLHQRSFFPALRGFVGRRVGIGHPPEAVLEFFLFVCRQRRKGGSAPFANGIAVAVQQNGAEPGEELALPVKAAEALPGFNQRVLGQVLSQARLAAQRHRLAQQPRLINPAHLAKRLRIPRPGLLQQTARLWTSGFHEHWVQAEHLEVRQFRSAEITRHHFG